MLLSDNIKFLNGVGERRAALLDSELGIQTAFDLIRFYPFRYVDRTRIYTIASITEPCDTFVQIRARITGFAYHGEGRKRRFCATVSDQSGTTQLVWFAGIKWVERRLELGREYIIFGRPTFFNGEFNMVHPDVELVENALRNHTQSIQGVYSTTEKLTSAGLGSKQIYRLQCNLWHEVERSIAETLPKSIIDAARLCSLKDALGNIHFPQSADKLREARYRLKFEELFGVQLFILSRRTKRTKLDNGFRFSRVGDYFNSFFYNRLPFEMTDAQKRVIRQIRADTITGHQMNRLLQGDVGSGKTVVALVTMLLAADNGFQSCMMAPTEILARQHFASIDNYLRGTPAEGRVAVLTGATKVRERREILDRTLRGEVLILIGTHALIEERVQFLNLGMVVIDEQHRFGVEQRARLWTKNLQPPHILVMTATPIPRTLAMTLYGDLDVSVIDQLPPGRKPIETQQLNDSRRLELIGFLKREIAKGRQVYVVFPLITGSEKSDYKDLEDGLESFSRDFPLPQYSIGAVHGRMSNDDKNGAMADFKSGITNILVATSVIEVGVDVPNATVMVIESAERFGLSQLHQLRGRVGRGAEQSYCILMSGDKLSREARARLDAMVATNDGFELSELDLRLRGSGDLEGTRQSGMAFDLKIASPLSDSAIVEQARSLAEQILDDDPDLTKSNNRLLAALRDRYSPNEGIDLGMIS